MSFLFGPRAGRLERRSVSFQDVFGTGGDVSEYGQNGRGLVALYAAHREILDAVASVPLHGYEERDGVAVRLDRDPGIIVPAFGTSFQWTAAAVASMLYDGNAFGLPTAIDERTGFPARVRWVNPLDVDVDDDAPLPRYTYLGRELSAVAGEIVHVPWIVAPGRHRAISPLRRFRLAWEAGQGAQQAARDWYAGGAIPRGYFKNVARKLTATQAREAKALFREAVEGRDTLVTGADWDYSAIGVPAAEQHFVEGIRMTAGQVAAVYGLPPEDLGGEAANSLTYATQESNERRRSQRVAAPWCTRLEQAFSLHTPGPQLVRYNLDAVVRADLKTRMESHAIALDNGVRTLDEVRALENEAPLTEAQWAQWVAWQRAKGGQDVATALQKAYLAVGKIITVGEARAIVRAAGGDLAEDVDAATVFNNTPPAPAKDGATLR